MVQAVARRRRPRQHPFFQIHDQCPDSGKGSFHPPRIDLSMFSYSGASCSFEGTVGRRIVGHVFWIN